MAARLKKVSTEPYKGVRDFYPADMATIKALFAGMREACERFGFVEVNASILEPAELYTSKGAENEEIVSEQSYTFRDRGDREVTLRPEMTPTIARMIAAKRRDLIMPVRWYSIPNVFRYERPQRGRVREHWQLNADIVGARGIEADAEIIALASELLRSFGATEEDFLIKVSSRSVLEDLFTLYGIGGEARKKLRVLIDKKDKLDDFDAQAEKLLGKPLVFPTEAPEDVASLMELLRSLGVTNAVFDPALARGFDYYTGMIFEVFDTAKENARSLFGGGRYDNLLSLFGVESVPAVGFGMGDVTLRDFLEVHSLLPALKPAVSLALCVAGNEHTVAAMQLSARLRARGVHVAVYLGERKVGDQVRWADRSGIPHIVVVGADELRSGTYRVKNLETGAEQKLLEADIPAALH